MELSDLSIHLLREKLTSGQIKPQEIIQSLANRVESRDSRLGAYLHFDPESALKQAENVDLSRPLGGIPIAIKDNINTKGDPCSCGSKMLHGHYQAPYDSTVSRKLKEAGAILLGRTNMDEFAMGSATENSAIQKTTNPWSEQYIPGGSSGGSAAAVGGGIAIAALGSDTGGSIRQPASYCGVVGLKPSYGRVSRYGLVAFASSLDQIGPLTQNVLDSALLLEVISGADPLDSTCLSQPVPKYSEALTQGAEGLKGLKIGLPKEYFGEGLSPDIRAIIESSLKKCEEAGAKLVEISLPHTKYAVDTYYIIATAEASANLARFDGIRYGNRIQGQDLIDTYRNTREAGFGPEVKRRILLGTYVLSSGYYDAYYLRAQKVRTLIRQDFVDAYQKVDVIACPTTPDAAFKFGEKSADPLKMYLADIYTIAANLSGVCGISTPAGMIHTEDGTRLPVGLQMLAPALGETVLLKAAHAWEKINSDFQLKPSFD